MTRSRRNYTLSNRKRGGGWGWLTRARSYMPSFKRNMDHNKSVYAPIKRAYPIQPEPAKQGYFTRKFSNLKSYFSRGRHHSAPKGSPPKGSPQKALYYRETHVPGVSSTDKDKFYNQLKEGVDELREKHGFTKPKHSPPKGSPPKHSPHGTEFSLFKNAQQHAFVDAFETVEDRKERRLKEKAFIDENPGSIGENGNHQKILEIHQTVIDEFNKKYEPAREEFNKIFKIYYNKFDEPDLSTHNQKVLKEMQEEEIQGLREKYGFTGRR